MTAALVVYHHQPSVTLSTSPHQLPETQTRETERAG